MSQKNPFFLLLFLSLFCTPLSVNSFAITDEYTPSIIQNGVLYQNKTITVLCSNSDMGLTQTLQVTLSNGSTTPVIINCGAPVTTYTGSVIGFIPDDGMLTRRRACMARNSTISTGGFSTLLNSSTRATLTVPGNSGFVVQDFVTPDHPAFRSMSVPPHMDRLLRKMEFGHDHAHWEGDFEVSKHDPRFKKHQRFLGIALSVVSIGLGIAGLIKNKDTGASFDDFVNKQNDKNKKFEDFQKQAQDWYASTADSIKNVRNEIGELTTIQADMQTQIGADGSSIRALQSWKNDLTRQLNTEFATITGSVSQTQSQLLQLASTVQQMRTSETTFASSITASLYNTSNFLNDQINQLGTISNSRHQNILARIRSLLQSVNVALGVAQDVYFDTVRKRSLTRLIQTSIFDITQKSTYKPFLKSYGILPSSNIGSYATLYIDDIRVMFLATTPGPVTAVQADFNIYCSIEFVIQNPSSTMDWQDLLTQLGPYDTCDPTNPATCKCFYSYVQRSCPFATGFGTTQFYNATALTTAMCTGGVLTGSFTQDLKSSENVTTTLSSLCQMGNYQQLGYAVASSRLNQVIRAPDNRDICSMTFGDIGDTNLNFAFVKFQFLRFAYQAVFANLDKYLTVLDGRLAANLSSKDLPYELTGNGDETASCKELAFVSYSSTLLPIFILQNPVTTTTVTVTVNGKTYGQNDRITISTPIGTQAETGYTLIGDPTAANVFDFHPDAISLDFAPVGRQGKVTYPMVNDSTKFNLDYWTQTYPGYDFDHYQAANFARGARRAVVSGRCSVPLGTRKGEVCTILDNYFIFSSGGGATFSLVPRVTSYSVTLPVPDGSYAFVVSSECPVVSLAPFGTGTNVQLSNPFPRLITVTLVVSGACSITYSGLSVPATGAYTQFIPGCTAGTTVITMRVYKTAGLGLGDECVSANGPYNVTTDVNRLVIQGVITQNYVDLKSQVSVDSVAAAYAQQTKQLGDILLQFSTTVLDTFRVNNLGISPSIASDYSAFQLNIAKLIGDINLTISSTERKQLEFSTSTSNFSVISAFYDQIINNNSKVALDAFNSAQLAVARLADLQNVSSAAFELYLNATQSLIRASQLYTEASIASDAALVTLLSNMKNSGNFWGNFGDALEDVGGFIEGLPQGVADQVNRFVNAVASVAKNAIGQVGGIFSAFLSDAILIGVACIAGGCAVYLAWKEYKERKGTHGNAKASQLRALESRIQALEQKLKEAESELKEDIKATKKKIKKAKEKEGKKEKEKEKEKPAPPPPPPPPPVPSTNALFRSPFNRSSSRKPLEEEEQVELLRHRKGRHRLDEFDFLSDEEEQRNHDDV